jgi:hypothetical protein
MRYINWIAASLFLIALPSFTSSFETTSGSTLKNGIWRATLARDTHRLPLLLDISKNPDDKTFSVFVVNGTERLKMDSTYIQNDSLVIPMQLFDAKSWRNRMATT